MQNKLINNKYGFSSEKSILFPSMVVVEITNVCNLACIHCPYSSISKQKDYQPKHMSIDTYKRIVDEVYSHPGTIFRLLCDGEPLCHPHFIEMLNYTKSKNISPMNFITNGLLLDSIMARLVLGSGIEAVEISIDAINKNTYDKIRKGSDFDTVMNNVHEFIKMRNELKANTKIFVSIIQQPESQSEYDDFIRYWTPKVDRVISRPLTSIGGLVETPKKQEYANEKRWPCPHLWRRLYVNIDGFAEFCVEDWHDKTIVGDIHKTNLADIWQSKKYNDLRKSHLAENFDAIPYCSKCRDWQARDWDYNYFHVLNETLNKN